MLDIGQGNEKVVANSFYGASGAKTSIFYNRDLAASVTATGQAEIATAMTSFESLLENNMKFYDMDECMRFIDTIVNKKKYKHKAVIKDDIKELAKDKIANTFFNDHEINWEILNKIFDNLSDEECAKLYYINNLKGLFLDFSTPNKLLDRLICYTPEFKNPNEVPEEIEGDLHELWKWIEEFCVWNFPIRNRIERDKYHRRKAVVVQDTDSNMITLDNLMNFLMENFVVGKNVMAISENDLKFILVNICCYFLTKYSELFLKRYCTDVNIPE